MNDNDLKIGSNDNEHTYRATTNLNTAIENPQVSIESMMGVNVYNSDTGVNNSYNQNLIDNVEESNKFSNNLDNYGNQILKNDQSFSNSQDGSFNSNMYQDNNQFNDNNVQTDYVTSNGNLGFVSSDEQNTLENVDNYLDDNGGVKKAVYKPALKQKKKPGSGFEISKQVKMMMFIIFILLLFLFVVPYIYDFFKGVGLVITSR